MQTDVEPLLAFHMDLGLTSKSFLFRYLWLAIGTGWSIFRRPVDYVVTRSGGHTLGKFSPMVGNQVPARMLLVWWMDRDLYTVQRPVVWSIGGAKDQGV